jgi:hypothetical protein
LSVLSSVTRKAESTGASPNKIQVSSDSTSVKSNTVRFNRAA